MPKQLPAQEGPRLRRKGKGELHGHFVKWKSQGQVAPGPGTSLSKPSKPSLPSCLSPPSARTSTIFPIGRDGFPPKGKEDTTSSPFPCPKLRLSPFITCLWPPPAPRTPRQRNKRTPFLDPAEPKKMPWHWLVPARAPGPTSCRELNQASTLKTKRWEVALLCCPRSWTQQTRPPEKTTFHRHLPSIPG